MDVFNRLYPVEIAERGRQFVDIDVAWRSLEEDVGAIVDEVFRGVENQG